MLPTFDWQKAISLAGNNEELAKDIKAAIQQSLPQDLTTIQALFEEKNYVKLQDAVHKLHGALCYTGFVHLKETAAKLELALKNNNEFSLPALVDQFAKEVARVLLV